jgi:pimeloyl-ACP methyl ester carboxylesterase
VPKLQRGDTSIGSARRATCLVSRLLRGTLVTLRYRGLTPSSNVTAVAATVELRDGRALGYEEWGPADGFPVLGFGGTTMSRLAHLGHEAPEAAGVRLVLVDRPGYGLSDLQPGRRLLDWPADVAELAAALRIERFAVFGMSGGGPHAAACGYALADSVSALGLVSSPGPVWDRPELRYSLPPRRQPLVELAARDPAAAERHLLEDCRRKLEELARHPESDDGTGPDRDVMANPEVRARFRASLLETVARGPEGYAHDLYILFVTPWGFRPEQITVETGIWHGDRDPAVPLEIGRFFGRTIPRSSLHVLPGEGHLLLWTHAEEVLTALKPA